MLSFSVGKRLSAAKSMAAAPPQEEPASEAGEKTFSAMVYSLELHFDGRQGGEGKVPAWLKPLVGLAMLINAKQYATALASESSWYRALPLSGVVLLSTAAAAFKGHEIALELYRTMLNHREQQLAKLVANLPDMDEKITRVGQKFMRGMYVDQRNRVIELLKNSRADLIKNVRLLPEVTEVSAFRASVESVFRSDLGGMDHWRLQRMERFAGYPAGITMSEAIEKVAGRATTSLGLATVLMGIVDMVDSFTNDKDDIVASNILFARGVLTFTLGWGTILRGTRATLFPALASPPLLIFLTVAVLIFDSLYWYFKGRDFDCWMKKCLWGDAFTGGPVLELCERFLHGKIDAAWRMAFELEEIQAVFQAPAPFLVKGVETTVLAPVPRSITSTPEVVFRFPGVGPESVLYYQFVSQTEGAMPGAELVYREKLELSVNDRGMTTLRFPLENVPASAKLLRRVYRYNGHWHLPYSGNGVSEGRIDISDRWLYTSV